MTERLHLLPRHRAQIEALLSEHLPNVEVWAYGSRANGQSHDGSDLDLVLRGPGLGKIDLDALADFGQALHDSTIPFLVEARDWARLPERFHREIEREYVVVARGYPSLSDDCVEQYGDRDPRANELWPRLRLGDCIETARETYRATEGWSFINYLDTGSVTEGRIENFQHLIVGEDEIPSRARRRVRRGDIVYSTVRPDQRHFGLLKRKVPENCLVSTGFSVMRSRCGMADTEYIYWFLTQEAVVGHLQTVAEHSTSAYPSIRPSDIEGLEIALPPLCDQRAIAYVLGTLDDKIELNRRMNETLEAMARALFKSWFVDFDPVRAKMEGRDTGWPQDIADLFPDRLVDSEMGEIPEGWRASTLADVALLNPESWSHRNAPDSVRYVDLANTKSGSIDDIREYTWAEAPSRARRVLRKGDTIVGTVRPGNRSFALIDRDGLTGSTGFAVLRPRNATEREIVWCVATSSDSIERLAHLADGGAYPAVWPGAVLDTVVALPDDGLRRTFSSLAAPLLNRTQTNRQEAAVLATLRDTLLPKLVSGEIRVPPAESLAPTSSWAQ